MFLCVCLSLALPTCTCYKTESRKRSSRWTRRRRRLNRLLHAAADMSWEPVHRDRGTEGGETEGGRTAFLTRHKGGCSLCVTLTHTHTHTSHFQATSWCETAGALMHSSNVGQSWQKWAYKPIKSHCSFACNILFMLLIWNLSHMVHDAFDFYRT